MWIDLRRMMLPVLLLLAACGEADGPSPGEGEASAVPSGPPAATAPAPGDAGAAPPAAAPETVADLFPEGPGRELVLANCASCHAVACAVIGQRTAPRWASLRDAHREHVANLPADDLDTIFAYLQDNFSEGQPEPFVPPEFMVGGCTPF